MSASPQKIPVGISSCLLGQQVRYDGGHRANDYIINTLADYFEFRHFCPELDIGLGVPRPPIQLRRQAAGSIRCVAVDDHSRNFTAVLSQCADRQADWHAGLCGYIFKQDSPSCGMAGVKVWDGEQWLADGNGIYAGKLMQNFPDLPVEEEGRLGDSRLRENFIERVLVLHRWQQLITAGITVESLLAFHQHHRLSIISHQPSAVGELEQIVAAGNGENIRNKANSYLHGLMTALKTPATAENHATVLQHIVDQLDQQSDRENRRELQRAVEQVRAGQLAPIEAIQLLNQLWPDVSHQYLNNSCYLQLHPAQMSSPQAS